MNVAVDSALRKITVPPNMFRTRLIAIAATAALFASNAEAVILYRTGDPAANITAPDLAFPHDGWDYEGLFGGFLGTAVAPHFFITANHIGGQDSVLHFSNGDYHVIASFADPTSDLHIYQVSETFPFFAPLYSRTDEVGQRIVDIGRGLQRGGEIYLNSSLRGWGYGASDNLERWGDNIIAGVYPNGPENDLLYADFDAVGSTANECQLASGDSGGAAFINDNGTWKLAGINYAIDSGFYTMPSDGALSNGAIFDLRGFYYKNLNGFVQIDPNYPIPVTTSFYPTRISTKLDWINSIIDPAGDYDGNGIKNLLQYALKINSPKPGAWSAPSFAVGGGFVTLTYRKIANAPLLTYQVEQSTDLVIWTAASAQETLVGTNQNPQIIEAKVATGGPALFLRLRITQ